MIWEADRRDAAVVKSRPPVAAAAAEAVPGGGGVDRRRDGITGTPNLQLAVLDGLWLAPARRAPSRNFVHLEIVGSTKLR